MMKKKSLLFKGLLTAVAVPMLMASCNHDEPKPQTNEYLTIGHVGIAEMEKRSAHSATSNFLPNSGTDSLTLFVQSSLSDAKYSRNFMQFSCNGSTWETDVPLVWGGGTAKWTAVYGADYKDFRTTDDGGNSLRGYSYCLYRKQNSNSPVEDILYAYGTTSDGNLNINLKHLTAKLRFNFYDFNKYSQDYTVQLPCNNTELYLWFNHGEEWYLGDRYNNLGMKASISPQDIREDWEVTPANGADKSYEYLTYPGKGASDYWIYTYHKTNPLDYNRIGWEYKNMLIEPNKSYIFDVYWKDNKVEKIDVTISAWEDAENATSLETKTK